MNDHPGDRNDSQRHPTDVTLAAVGSAGDSFGYSYYAAPDRLLFPRPDHHVTAYVLGGPGRLADVPTTLVFEGRLRRGLDLSRMHQLATTLNSWNRERLGPTVSFQLSDDGDVVLRTRFTLQVRSGLGGEQLAGAVNQAMETTELAVQSLTEVFPELIFPEDFSPDGPEPNAGDPRNESDQLALHAPIPGAIPDAAPGPDGSGITGDGPVAHGETVDLFGIPHQSAEFDRRRTEPQPEGTDRTHPDHPSPGGDHPTMSPRHRSPEPDGPADAGGSLPYPVTLERIRSSLADLGVARTRGDDEVIVAWVNDVLFGFFLDNGPSYLVKGHWDPNLDPVSDFMRVFLLCNDWNEASINTKAFCHSDDDGLQVRVEFTAPVGEGMNDAQLGHNTAVAINQVLHALDSISSDAVGESVVGWPRGDET